jgi:hypothetical protein
LEENIHNDIRANELRERMYDNKQSQFETVVDTKIKHHEEIIQIMDQNINKFMSKFSIMEVYCREEISKLMIALDKYPTPKELHDFIQKLLKNIGEYDNMK